MMRFTESFIHDADCCEDVEIRSDCEFIVYQSTKPDGDFIPIGPDSVHDRVWKKRLDKDETIYIDFSGVIAFTNNPVNRYDPSGGDKIVEIIPESEMNMYDRMRAELLSVISDMAVKRGDESFEEADDLEFEDEESDQAPLTPYEFQDMQEEYLVEDDVPENSKDVSEETPPPENSFPDQPAEEKISA